MARKLVVVLLAVRAASQRRHGVDSVQVGSVVSVIVAMRGHDHGHGGEENCCAFF